MFGSTRKAVTVHPKLLTVASESSWDLTEEEVAVLPFDLTDFDSLAKVAARAFDLYGKVKCYSFHIDSYTVALCVSLSKCARKNTGQILWSIVTCPREISCRYKIGVCLSAMKNVDFE